MLKIKQDTTNVPAIDSIYSREGEYKYYKINDQQYGFPVYKCNKRWAANLLLQEAMKGERQTARRRLVSIILYLFLNIH